MDCSVEVDVEEEEEAVVDDATLELEDEVGLSSGKIC